MVFKMKPNQNLPMDNIIPTMMDFYKNHSTKTK